MTLPIGVSIASTTSLPGEVARNLNQIATFARRAQADGADLLLTPELSVSGYGGYPEVIATAEVAGDGPIFETLAHIATANALVIAAGFVEEWGNRHFIAHYVVFPDGRFVVQRKFRVTPAEHPLQSPLEGDLWQTSLETPGIQFPVFEVAGVPCALVICADIGVVGLDESLQRAGVKLLLLPTGAGGKRHFCVSTTQLATQEGRERYLESLRHVFLPGDAPIQCLQWRRALAAVNLCGYDGRAHYHVGHGSITTALGEVAALLPGIPHLERQRPTYNFARFDAAINLDNWNGKEFK